MRPLLSIAVLPFFAVPAWAQMTPPIAKALTATLQRNSILAGLKVGCIAYHVEGETASVLEVQIYEIHDRRQGCSGDEGTAPTIANVLVLKDTRQVLRVDPATSRITFLR